MSWPERIYNGAHSGDRDITVFVVRVDEGCGWSLVCSPDIAGTFFDGNLYWAVVASELLKD